LVFPQSDGGDDLVLVPEGTYEVTYVKHALVAAFNGRLVVTFAIVSTNDSAFGKCVTAWYPVKILDRSRGTFSVGRHSKFARHWRVIFQRGADRWDRVPMSALKGVRLSAKVRTVIKDFAQEHLAKVNTYSVVDHIIGRIE
jgi:hypothetical protein